MMFAKKASILLISFQLVALPLPTYAGALLSESSNLGAWRVDSKVTKNAMTTHINSFRENPFRFRDYSHSPLLEAFMDEANIFDNWDWYGENLYGKKLMWIGGGYSLNKNRTKMNYQDLIKAAVPLTGLVAAMQGNQANDIAIALKSGREKIIDLISNVSLKSFKATQTALNALIEHPFANIESRPVIELLLNAIDTQERYYFSKGINNKEKEVVWSLKDGETIIRDKGEGINLSDLTKLLNPGEGGNIKQMGTTGRFGAGFLSALHYLDKPDDVLIIKSVSESESNHFLFFRGQDKEIYFHYLPLSISEKERLQQGTEIQIISSKISVSSIEKEANKTLKYKDDAKIYLDKYKFGEYKVFNPKENLKTITSVSMENIFSERKAERPAISLKYDRKAGFVTNEGKKTEIQFHINGVYFESIYLDKEDQLSYFPKEIVIDFHKSFADYARDRNAFRLNDLTYIAFESLINLLEEQHDGYYLLRYANIFYNIANELKQRTRNVYEASSSHDISKIMTESITRIINREKWQSAVFLRTDPRLERFIDCEKGPVFFMSSQYFNENRKIRIPDDYKDSRMKEVVYLPFKSTNDRYVLAMSYSKEYIIVSDKLRVPIEHLENRVELEVLLRVIQDISKNTKPISIYETFTDLLKNAEVLKGPTLADLNLKPLDPKVLDRVIQEIKQRYSTEIPVDINIQGKLLPEKGIHFPDENLTRLNYSELLSAQSKDRTSELMLEEIQDIDHLQKVMKEIHAKMGDARSELQERAQLAIKRAYEQTTEPFAFLREMTTNAYRAVQSKTENSKKAPLFKLKSKVEDNRFYLSLTDEGVGMDIQDVVGKLLYPSLTGWGSDYLHFGQGFYTLFRDGDEVRIRTIKNNVSTVLRLVPIKEEGFLKDIQIEMVQSKSEAPSGTTIEWIKDVKESSNLTNLIEKQLRSYVQFFNNEKMGIIFNDKFINETIEPLVSKVSQVDGSRISIYDTPGENRFYLNQVYLRDLNQALLEPIPSFFQDLLEKSGITIHLESEDSEPLEGRMDFVNRQQKLDRISSAYSTAAILAAIKLIANGRIDIHHVLPYDYTSNAERYKNDREAGVLLDAAMISRGLNLEDLNKYYDYKNNKSKQNSILLALSVPVLSIENVKEMYSLFDAIIRGKKEPEFLDKLPSWLKLEITMAMEGRNIVGEEQTNIIHKNDLQTVESITILPSDEGSQVILSWEALVRYLLKSIDEKFNRQTVSVHEYFINNEGSIAYTQQGKNNIAWNLTAVLDELNALHHALVSEDERSFDSEGIRQLFYQLINTTTHEVTHILRNESEQGMTHDQKFFEDQLYLLNILLLNLLKVDNGMGMINEINRLSKMYQGQLSEQLRLPNKFYETDSRTTHTIQLKSA